MSDQLLANMKFLVVEDEMLVMMAIEDMLTDLGCQSVTVASTIGQALGLILTKDFDFAMLDVNLDGQLSDPVALALHERGVSFIFSTGYGAQGVAAGFEDNPVLTKPFSNQQLLVALTQLIEMSRQEAA